MNLKSILDGMEIYDLQSLYNHAMQDGISFKFFFHPNLGTYFIGIHYENCTYNLRTFYDCAEESEVSQMKINSELLVCVIPIVLFERQVLGIQQ